MGLPRILCIMGSGETAPNMVSVHAALLKRMGDGGGKAVFIDTPFGFQENADELVAKAQEYFEKRVGFALGTVTLRNSETATTAELETALAKLEEATYVFAGPGSPSYALENWMRTEIPALLRRKLQKGGCITFASAAALTLGAKSIPVYEIYKVGKALHWLDGMDLMGELGLHVAVVPHFDNAEGGSHDTRFCYMGERRLRLLQQMADDIPLLGIDEHTGIIFDLDADEVSVAGRGALTICNGDEQTVYPSGTTVSLQELREKARGRIAPAVPVAQSNGHLAPLDTFELAAEQRDVDGMLQAIFEIEAAASSASNDTEELRRRLRRCIARLGELARTGAGDPKDQVAPFVNAMLTMREEARSNREFERADKLRDMLIDCGIEVRDSREGSDWELVPRA